MKNLLSNLLMVLGFCVGAIGATGFHSPADSANSESHKDAEVSAPASTAGSAMEESSEVSNEVSSEGRSTENYAWALLIGGIAVLGAGALLGRGARGDALAGGKSGVVAAIQKELVEIQSLVAGLDESKHSLENAELMARIDDMRTGVLFDLGSRSDTFAAQIGFDAYARVWGDFATCERLLNRSWSMAADGHTGESRAEIPLAHAAIDAAVDSCASLA